MGDGDRFVESLRAPIVAQDIKNEAGRMVIAGPKGPCTSSTGGLYYSCVEVPLKYNQTGRYVSSPSKDVIYFTAGQWPSQSKMLGAGQTQHLSEVVRLTNGVQGKKSFELGLTASDESVDGVYTAELWKSADGGATWKNLITDEGNFYFNDVHCADETHCIAVGEGFAKDGSANPGARIYRTEDGENFKLVHTENAKGTESLMSAYMLSPTEHWAGGATSPGGFLSPALILHSTDAGQTHTNEGSTINGQMITAMDFLSAEHGYATSMTALQTCDLLEFGGSTPPAPSPTPTPGQPHYEKPPCQTGEAQASVTGADGVLCAPPCDSSGACPTDVPAGVTANPLCALKDQSGNQFCALECSSDDQCDKAGGAACSTVQAGAPGVCTYPSNASSFVTMEHSLSSIVV